MTLTPRDLATLDLGGSEVAEIERWSEKSLLARGYHDGRPVIIKVLRTDEVFWRAKFAHEIRLYLVFSAHPPPVRVPRLVHTDSRAVLVVEHLAGTVVDTDRYSAHPWPETTLDGVLEAVTGFARWNPPAGALGPVFDYPARLDRYHRLGFFTDDDHAALQALLQQVPPPEVPAHGDPLPANLLRLVGGGCALLDFEFTGLFLPGFDLAMLHTLLDGTPGVQRRIETLARESGIQTPFQVNQAMVLSRELRLHIELPPGERRDQRLAHLGTQWNAFRQRLHARR
ncbi:phosphotransferase [Saccharopolyspora shandongensis]|uniref:phosphotransferase n=1 Tax=Saccharopolyspora shandongensis TaxID=418495 RepID=UPI0033E2366E